MNLHAPDRARSSTPGISNSTWVRIRRSNAGSKLAAMFVAKITTPLNVSSSCSSTLTTAFSRAGSLLQRDGTPRRDGVGFVEQQHRVPIAGEAKHAHTFLGRRAHPHGLDFGVADDQKPPAERVGDCFGADGLPGARRAGEVEGERQSARMPLPQPPPAEDQVVAGDLGERLVDRSSCRRREDDIVERSTRHDCVDGPFDIGKARELAKRIRHRYQGNPVERGLSPSINAISASRPAALSLLLQRCPQAP